MKLRDLFLIKEVLEQSPLNFVKKLKASFITKVLSPSKNLPLKQNHFLNQNGISTIAPLLLSLAFSLGVLGTFKAIRINQVIRERKQVYLCLKESEFSKRSYIKKMGHLNKLIHGAFLARAIPPLAPYAKQVQESAKYLQQFIHFAELKNAFRFKNCSSLVALNYIRNLPYKNKGARLLRRLDGTAPLSKKTWKEYLWSKNRLIFLQSSQELKSRFSAELQSKRREFSREALQNLRDSYGPLFSFSY